MIKYILVFIIGGIETWLFTKWNLRANKAKALNSSIMMVSYMGIYLVILDTIFKDANSKLLILFYVLACGVGNFLAVKHEKKKEIK